MPVFKTEEIRDPKTGEQKVNKKGVGLTRAFTDPIQHKLKVRDGLFDQLYNSMKSNQFEKSDPVTDLQTGKIYIMKEGNSQVNRPERGLYIGPIIEEITADEARAERPSEKATLENVMARIRKLEEEGKLKDEKIVHLEKRDKPQENIDDAYDIEKGMKDFFDLDGRSHIKFIEDGKVDLLLDLLITHPDTTDPTKKAIEARKEILSKETG